MTTMDKVQGTIMATFMLPFVAIVYCRGVDEFGTFMGCNDDAIMALAMMCAIIPIGGLVWMLSNLWGWFK